MILSGEAIADLVDWGDIVIEPFSQKLLNPNSYNLRLANELVVYDLESCGHLDCRKDDPTKQIIIPDDGYILRPGILYLARTFEYTETHKHVPMLEGRSSIARKGLKIHVTAGFGDVGYCGNWTLEMETTHPLKIYPMMEVAQIYYCEIKGDFKGYDGKYQGSKGVVPSMLYRDFDRPQDVE